MSPKGGVIDMGHARLGRTVRSMAAGLIDRRSRVGGGVGATGLPAQAATLTAATPTGTLPPGLTWAVVGTSTSTGAAGVAVHEVGTGEAQGTLVGTSTEAVVFSCQAVSVGTAASTGVGCYMVGANGVVYGAQTVWLPGLTSVTAGEFIGPVQDYALCVGFGNLSITGQVARWLTSCKGSPA